MSWFWLNCTFFSLYLFKQKQSPRRTGKTNIRKFFFHINIYLTIDTACTNYIWVTRVEFETENVIRGFQQQLREEGIHYSINSWEVWHNLTCKGTNIFKDVKKCHEIGEGAHKTFRISQFPEEFRRGIGKTGCIFLGQFKSVKYLKRVIINDVLAYFFISMEIPFRGIPIFSYFFQFSKETSILIKNSFSI